MINKVKNVVDSRGISVYRFRQETGMSATAAYELYNNPKHLPSLKNVERICEAYKLQPNDLLEIVSQEDYQKI